MFFPDIFLAIVYQMRGQPKGTPQIKTGCMVSFVCFGDTVSSQAGLKFTNLAESDFERLILLSPFPECWNYRCVPRHLASPGAEDQILGTLSKYSID